MFITFYVMFLKFGFRHLFWANAFSLDWFCMEVPKKAAVFLLSLAMLVSSP
jgi:hypothetical protein